MQNQRTLKEVLDSDDELTTDYIETSYVPAYKNDARFQNLNLNNNSPDKSVPQELILSMKDAYCFQCMQRVSKETQKWFVTFMLYKDLQSKYNFLQSCLTPKYL